MITSVERIRKEIAALPAAERLSLWQDLSHDLDALISERQSLLESSWNAEITSRAQDITSGNVALVSGSEFEQRTRNLFAELGISREPRRVEGAD